MRLRSSASTDAIGPSRPNAPDSVPSERSMPRLTSPARTSLPVEKRTPRRIANVYVFPPSDGAGSDCARFGTTCVPALPPVRRNAVSPS